MIHKVHLERFPPGLQFPPELAARASYSVDTCELRFDGFMSKTDFDKLVRLTNDLAYQRSLEKLFQISSFASPQAQPSANRKPLVYASAGLLAIGAPLILAWALFFRAPQGVAEPAMTPTPVALPAAPMARHDGDVGGLPATSRETPMR